MAIFKKDLENINKINEKNQKEIDVRTSMLQLINFQNETSNYDLSDLKFELDINFKKKSDKTKEIFRNIGKSRIDNKSFGKLFNLFNDAKTKNTLVFSSFERLIYAIKQENELFKNELSIVSNSIKRSKEIRFDLLHSFLLNTYLPDFFNNNVFLSEKHALYATAHNLEVLDIKDSINNQNLATVFNKVVDNSVTFVTNYAGFNFLESDQNNLILNHSKPLSLMSLATSMNNIIENSFDYASCNSLFKGIYTDKELNSKIKFNQFTNVPMFEHDLTKEILPLKYVDEFNLINNNNVKRLIDAFNDNIFQNADLKDVRKSSQEAIRNDIFAFESLLCNDSNTKNVNFTSKINIDTKSTDNRNDLLDINDDFLAHVLLANSIIVKSPQKRDLVVNNKKSALNCLESLNLIANHLNTNQLKLLYGTVKKTNRQADYSNLKYRRVLDVNKKGLHNFIFDDINNFTASIIKTRLQCNNIVKKYKKYALNNGVDASTNSNANIINFLMDANGVRKNVEENIKANTLLESISKIDKNKFVISNNIFENFQSRSYIFEIFNKPYNRLNKDLIIINSKIIGDPNIDDFITANLENVENLNNHVNSINLNLGGNKPKFNEYHAKVLNFANRYYIEQPKIFKNSTGFFQELKNLCAKSIKWHSSKKANTKMSSDRADLLNNASILWLFNDNCREMTDQQKETFQDEFINLLISYVFISKKRLTALKNAYNVSAENVIINRGPTPNTITELAPFFCFFTDEVQNAIDWSPNAKNKFMIDSNTGNEYYNVTSNLFETNGKAAHFLSVPALLLDENLNLSYNTSHKLGSTKDLDQYDLENFSEAKRNILLAGANMYIKYTPTIEVEYYQEYKFVPQLTLKKIFYGDNKYKLDYFLYNTAFMDSQRHINTTNSFTSYDLVQYLIDNYNDLPRDMAAALRQSFSHKFSTQNAFLNVMTFGGEYAHDVENDALENNIFYKITSLFENIITSLPVFNNFNGFISNLNSNQDQKISDLKFMLKTTLQIASSIYCKMFNTLQSYTNLSDRIAESNFFFENSLSNQTRLTSIVNDNNLRQDNYATARTNALLNWSHYSNIFLNNINDYSNFNKSELKKYRSFASKKFVYFLNEVLGIQKEEISMIMEYILSKKISSNRTENDSFQTTLKTRYQRLKEKDVFNQFINLNQLDECVNIKNRDDLEFLNNPFDLFNLYNGSLFQLIPGLGRNNDGEGDFSLRLTNNLTLLNYFKAGNNCDQSTVDIYRSPSYTLNRDEILKLQDSLVGIELFTVTRRTISQNVIAQELILDNLTRVVASEILPIELIVESNPPIIFDSDGDGVASEQETQAAIAASNNANNTIQYLRETNENVLNNEYADIHINFRDFEAGKTDYPIQNKKNVTVKPKINTNSIFDLLVENSYELAFNYGANFSDQSTATNSNNTISSTDNENILSNLSQTNEASNLTIQQNNLTLPLNDVRLYRLAGLKESYSYKNNFMSIKNITNVSEIDFNLNLNDQLLNQKYVDINLNWYNHVLHGLITNDLGLSLSIDLILYYFKNFIVEFESNFNKLTEIRNKKINLNRSNLNVKDSLRNLRDFTGLDLNLTSTGVLSTQNVKLQKNYLKSLIKAKAFNNIINLKNSVEILTGGMEKFIEKIVTLDKKNENGDILMSYFDDFYIKDFWHSLNTDDDTTFKAKINKNYSKINNENYIVPNQAEELLGSHLLTIGLENNYDKLDKDDIILIKVEMTDHDFPEIVFEPKVFEYFSSFDDLNNVFFQHKNALKIQNIDDITIDNPPLQINSFYSSFELNEASLATNNLTTLKDALIQKGEKIVNGLNLSNNIGSLTYKGNTSYLNPFVFQNNFENIQKLLIESNQDFIYSKISQLFKEKLTESELQVIRHELLQRCIHNQKLSLRFSKLSKLINGFEPKTEFSLRSNKWLQESYILADVYQLMIEDFESNFDMIKEIYPFSLEEISSAIEKNAYTYSGYTFHKAHFTTNHNLNIYLEFMRNLTKALIPDFMEMAAHKFQKVYTLAINPKDFVVTGLTGGNKNIVPNTAELEFQKISFSNNVNNKIVDEIGTEPSLILRLISNKTTEIDDINYYRIINRKTDSQYIPKNVSYKISTSILE